MTETYEYLIIIHTSFTLFTLLSGIIYYKTYLYFLYIKVLFQSIALQGAKFTLTFILWCERHLRWQKVISVLDEKLLTISIRGDEISESPLCPWAANFTLGSSEDSSIGSKKCFTAWCHGRAFFHFLISSF